MAASSTLPRTRNILITGGAGFVGSHLADELLAHGHRVRVLDNLTPQVHGDDAVRPAYLSGEVELIVGDVRDPAAVEAALEGIEVVFHFAAAVGVGQSMYEIAHYTDVNGMGTAVLLEALTRQPIERLVVASSMSIYGEGLYENAAGERRPGAERGVAQLQQRDWEVRDEAGRPLTPVPTPESKFPALPSVYAISKYHQERLCMNVAPAYGIEPVALRFFNIYGPRQALSNPYTGVLAIFAARLLNDRPPLINEDGHQRRDFVSVYDIAQACRLAIDVPAAAGGVFNVGSGQSWSVLEIAAKLARVLGKEHLAPEITGKCRIGDIRNCFADITHARDVLQFEPRMKLDQGLEQLAESLEGQIAVDRVDESRDELAARGLAI